MRARARVRATDGAPRPVRPDDAIRALSDHALILAMRDDDPRAWHEFDLRFRPALERYAECIGIPDADWAECVTNTLTDAALRFVGDPRTVPESCMAYLTRAVRNRAMNRSRTEGRVVRIDVDLPSPTDAAGDAPGAVVAELANRLRAGLSPDQELLLAWVAEGVPYRQIAEWLGIGYEATAKRIARLTARLRTRLASMAEDASPAERGAIAKLLDLPDLDPRN